MFTFIPVMLKQFVYIPMHYQGKKKQDKHLVGVWDLKLSSIHTVIITVSLR